MANIVAIRFDETFPELQNPTPETRVLAYGPNSAKNGYIKVDTLRNLIYSRQFFGTTFKLGGVGEYAPIWRAQLTVNQSYMFQIWYLGFTSDYFDENGQRPLIGRLDVAFAAKPDAAELDPDRITITHTDAHGQDGDFVIQDNGSGLVTIYVKKTAWNQSTQFGYIGAFSTTDTANLVNQGVYGALPASTGSTIESTVSSGEGAIINNLESTRADASLSANQGRVLKELIEDSSTELAPRDFYKADGINYRKGPKDIIIEDTGDIIITPPFMGNLVITKFPVNIRGVVSAAGGNKEFSIDNTSGGSITVENGFVGAPANSSFNIGSTLTIPNGGKAAFKSEDDAWVLGVVNETAFSDHLDSVNAKASVGSDGLRVITGVNDTYTGEIVSFKEIDYTPSIFDGNVFTKFNNINVKRVVKSINYAMFGAKGDGINDDAVQIKLAHQVANLLDLPVINEEGEYWLINPNGIEIQTNVSWGKSVFHIDESKNNGARFIVKRSKEPVTVTLGPAQKSAVISKVNSNADAIPELSEYSNHLIKIIDDNDRVGRRNGVGNGLPKTEFFALCDGGRVIHDNYWKFTDYTLLQAFFTEDKFITVQGGEFVLNGLPNPNLGSVYVSNGFSINRSKTIIRDQVVRYASGGDVTTQYLNGFYTFTHTHDTLLENITAPPRKVASAGSYGIGGGNMTLNCTFRNVTSEGGEEYASSVGTNNMKDFTVDNCVLNRLDVHFNGQNLTIRRSKLGYEGVQVTGSGKLLIEDTSVKNEFFVTFRQDYGGTWDGDIVILRSRLSLYRNRYASILQFFTSAFDVKNIVSQGKTIKIEDFVFDYTSVPTGDNVAVPITFGSTGVNETGDRYSFPSYISLKNIRLVGRSRKIRLFTVPTNIGDFMCDNPSSIVGEHVRSNVLVDIDNVEGTDDVSMLFPTEAIYVDDLSPVLKIDVKNSGRGDYNFGNFKGLVTISGTEIRGLVAGSAFQGFANFNSCVMKPDDRFFGAKSVSPNVSFRDCLWDIPIVEGIPVESIAAINNRFGSTINLNVHVKGNHINSILSEGLLSKFTPRPEFMSMLRSHFRTENHDVIPSYGTSTQRPSNPPYIGFQYYDTDLGYVVYWTGSSWTGTNIIRTTGAKHSVDDGTQLSGTVINGNITSVINITGTANGFPNGYVSVVTFNGSNYSTTWSIAKTLVSGTIYVQYYNDSGVGQGWVEITSPNASTTRRGIIEQATDAEVQAGEDTERAVSPKQLKENYTSLAERTNNSSGTVALPPLSYNVKEERITFSSTGTVTLNGFTAALSDRTLILINRTPNDLTVAAGASVAVPFSDALVIPTNQSARFQVNNNLILKEI